MNATSNIHLLYDRINSLKRAKDVVLLAHYYMPSELQLLEKDGGIADFVGDSLGLSLEAKNTAASNILFCGVHFMAETALLVSPEKQVFMPDPEAGCSLASSISASDIVQLRKEYPGVPVMGYINTTAETKTELDICCTSRNAVDIALSLESERIIFVPDQYMGENLRAKLKAGGKELILWKGTCEVHEQFRNDMIEMVDEDTEVLMHWEVPGDTVSVQLHKHKGIVGSTGDILKYVQESKAQKFYLASECDLGTALAKNNADKQFITPCIKCPHMKQNTIEKLLNALEAINTPDEIKFRIHLDKDIIERAKLPVMRMINF
ncbi:MAG: quinolinate synthase NadA [Bacteroidia bacterium]|jgi:quinolinate synthase